MRIAKDVSWRDMHYCIPCLLDADHLVVLDADEVLRPLLWALWTLPQIHISSFHELFVSLLLVLTLLVLLEKRLPLDF